MSLLAVTVEAPSETTLNMQLTGHQVPGVVAVLCESIAGPHQLIAAKKLNLLNQNLIRRQDKTRQEKGGYS